MHSPFDSLPRIEDCAKRIRVFKAGVCLFDTTQAKLVWLNKYYPVYFFPHSDQAYVYLEKVTEDEDKTILGITIGKDPTAAQCVTLLRKGPLAGYMNIRFDAMDAWFEEDEEILYSPKDPHKRVDILQSSRHVRIEISGVEVANTRSPRLLFETGAPMRTYILKTDCRMDLWRPSKLVTGCPYKGEAKYYNIELSSGETFENIVWWYPNTTNESAAVQGLVSFYDEKVDVWVDGVKQERPKPKI